MLTTNRRSRRWLAVLVILAQPFGTDTDVDGQTQGPTPTNSTVIPEARPGSWLKEHEACVALARKGNIDLLFLGDSITGLWPVTAPNIWARYYAPRRAAKFGIGGDRTQNMLWRIDHGEVDGIKPNVVVLMIGTNNMPRDTDDQIFEGIKAVVERLRVKLPDSKILLLGVTPRGVGRDPSLVTTPPEPRVAKLNEQVARLDDGKFVRYLDIGPKLLDDSGQVVQKIQPDFMHFSRKGYQIWAEAMEPLLLTDVGGKMSDRLPICWRADHPRRTR